MVFFKPYICRMTQSTVGAEVKKMQKVNQEALRTSTDYYKAMLSAL